MCPILSCCHDTTCYIQGLYPEAHGIVGNYFYDRVFREIFAISSPVALDPKWWLGEPVSYCYYVLLGTNICYILVLVINVVPVIPRFG